MLTTKQNVLRRFWYAVIADGGPQGRAKAVPPARRGHRPLPRRAGQAGRAARTAAATAPPSCPRAGCKNGQIVCGYHGWTYDRTGKLVHVPQFPVQQEVPNLSTPAYHCEERYGYVWVALDEPLTPILGCREENDPAFRRIPQFYEVWNTVGRCA